MTTTIAIIWLLLKATAFAFAMIAVVLWLGIAFGVANVANLITFLVENWIIQTLIGAWVVLKTQQAIAASNRSMARLESAYVRKTDAINNLYGLIERRIYATRRYLATIDLDPAHIDIERQLYKAAVSEWNEQAKLHQINLLLEYDAYFGLLLDHRFFPTFSKIDRLLRAQRVTVQGGGKVDKNINRSITKEINELSHLALEITREMKKIADKDRKILDGDIEIRLENADLVSYSQVLKALFVPRVQ